MSESSPPLTCAIHPKKETRLRCNRCEKPICIKCAQLTPTGYRCPDCIRSQKKTFITVKWYDYVTGSLAAGILSFLGSLFSSPFGFYTILVAPVIATIIVAVVRKIIQNRRSPRLYWVVAAAALLASLPLLLINLSYFFFQGEGLSLGMGLPILWQGLYSVIITTTVYYRIS